MLSFLGDLLIICLLGGVIGFVLTLLSEGGVGGIIIKEDYDILQRDSDEKIKNIPKKWRK